MNRSKKSILNATFALLQMVVTSIFGLILSRTVLSYLGSDYNGINSIVTQIVNVIMILEGGFTLASNVALFKPFLEKNITKINGILSATARKFNIVSLIAMVIGIIIALIFPFYVSTNVSYFICACLMITVLLPACFNLGYSMKYRVILLADQKEYIISIFSTIFYAIGNAIAVILIRTGFGIITARVVIMIFLFLTYYFIGEYCKKNYNFVQFKEKPMYNEISESKNVLALKLTSMLYTSFPIVLISSLPEKGAMIASVYAVYKSVISIVQNCLSSITNAPRLGFGSLIAEGNLSEANIKFNLYEKITFIGMTVIIGTTCLLILPFIDLYTIGVNDINYHNEFLAFIMLITVFVEICHIPSGQMIQMSGNFNASKKIQSIAFVILIFGMIVGRFFIGLYGILFAILLAAMVLCVLEIGYTGIIIFNRNWLKFIINLLPCLIICLITILIGFSGKIIFLDYLSFFIAGLVCVTVLTVITLIIYYVIDSTELKTIIKIVISIIK